MGKEAIYDEQINPLMSKIIDICKQHKIAMLADFSLEEDDDDLHCTSALLNNDYAPSKEQLECWKLLKPKRAFAMAITEETKPNGDVKITMQRVG